MNRLPIYKLTLLTAVDKGMIDPDELQGFMDDVFGQGIISITSEHFKGLIYTVKVDDTEMVLMSDNGEVELTVLREEEGKERQEIIQYQIALWKSEQYTRQLEKELDEKKALIESGITSFDRRLEDARNLIWGYEQMAEELNNIKITAQTLNRNIGIYRDDYDSLFIVWSLLCASIEHVSDNPNDYNDLPF